jgi:hypothetical protein
VLTFGRQYLAYGVGKAVILDSIMVLLFIAYIISTMIKRGNEGGGN